MEAALSLARRGLGRVAPNPAVGCIIVRDQRVVGRGWTQPGGRPHAETEALARAGTLARGATLYVTLEPCSHRGQTGPCAEAVIAAGVARVVAAMEDPDPRVSGTGLARLKAAGLDVETGLYGTEAAAVNAGFLLRVTARRPLVTLKMGTTIDGRIATHGGESRWITGEAARARAHWLRASHDAILVGSGTALVDDPELTCRLPGLGDRSPIRIVLDGRLRLPLTSKLVVTAATQPTWLVTLAGGDSLRRRAYEDCKVETMEISADRDGYPDLQVMLETVARRGVTRLLVEGGSHLAAALLRQDFVDRLVWFRAPAVMGGDGIPAAMPFGVDHLAQMPAFTRLRVQEVGSDLMEIYARQR